MQLPQSKYRSKLYRDFRAIEPNEWRKVVHFYEVNEAEIRGLEFEEYFELLNGYTNSLFEIGAWQQHLLMADAVIEASILENIMEWDGEDVLQHSLFRKAASHFQLHELERTEYTLRELLRINPHHHDAGIFLKKCLRNMRPWMVRQTRAAAILLSFLAALTILAQIFVVKNFYPALNSSFEWAWRGMLALAVVILGLGEIYHHLRSTREVENFVKGIRSRRKSNRCHPI